MNGEQSYDAGYALGLSGSPLTYPLEYVDNVQYNLGYQSGIDNFSQDQETSQHIAADILKPTYADGYSDGLLGNEKLPELVGCDPSAYNDYTTGYDAGYAIYSKNNITSPSNIKPTYADGYADGIIGKEKRQGGIVSDFLDYNSGYNDGYKIYLENNPQISTTNITDPSYADGYDDGIHGRVKLTAVLGADYSEYNNGYNDGYAIEQKGITKQSTLVNVGGTDTTKSDGSDTTTLQNFMYKNGYNDGTSDGAKKDKNFFVNPENNYYDFYASGYDAGKVVYDAQNKNVPVITKQVSPILIIGIVLFILYMSK